MGGLTEWSVNRIRMSFNGEESGVSNTVSRNLIAKNTLPIETSAKQFWQTNVHGTVAKNDPSFFLSEIRALNIPESTCNKIEDHYSGSRS